MLNYLHPKVQTVQQFLDTNTKKLAQAGISTPRLDCLVLLEHITGQDRATILANPEKRLTVRQEDNLGELIKRRLNREPIAYLTNKKEFYGRNFYVDGSVLIPRPESEAIIETLKELVGSKQLTIVDVGTGSGALAITVKLEFPNTRVIAIDNDTKALKVAQKNARFLGAEIHFEQGDLMQPLLSSKGQASIVIANLPYVSESDETSQETKYEPKIALYAKENGLALYKKLFKQIPSYLCKSGYLIIEANPLQHLSLIKLANNAGLEKVSVNGLCIAFKILDS